MRSPSINFKSADKTVIFNGVGLLQHVNLRTPDEGAIQKHMVSNDELNELIVLGQNLVELGTRLKSERGVQ